MSEEEKIYYDKCNISDPSMSYEEYVVHIFRCLMLSSWHQSAESATELISERRNFIREAYEGKWSVIDAMAEVGYCCG